MTLLKTVPHTLDISNRTKNWSIYPKLVVEYDSVKKIKKIDGRFFSIVDPYRQCLLKTIHIVTFSSCCSYSKEYIGLEFRFGSKNLK